MVFAQLLVLCSLLAVTGTATNGLGIGIDTVVVLVLSNLVAVLFLGIITPRGDIPVFVLLIAATVTVVDMLINAWLHEKEMTSVADCGSRIWSLMEYQYGAFQ